MKNLSKIVIVSLLSIFGNVGITTASANTEAGVYSLEEVVVTARRRHENMQDTPIAVSVMSAEDFEIQGINDITDLNSGYVPSVRIAPFPLDPATPVIFIRGVGNSDAAQISKDAGVYLDGVYMGRVQGLGAELVDLEHLEVLRGAQGTLFGRNATGGALNMISRKPTGNWGTNISHGIGNFGQQRSKAHINLPSINNVSGKVSVLHSERDGWLENSAVTEKNYNFERKSGGRLALRLDMADEIGLTADYSYDVSEVQTTPVYYQIYSIENSALTNLPIMQSGQGVVIAPELRRLRTTRSDTLPVVASDTDITGHSLALDYVLNDNMALRSISAYRTMMQDGLANLNTSGAVQAGPVLLSGILAGNHIRHRQFSQEFQISGLAFASQLSYVGGLYWYEESAEDQSEIGFTTTAVPLRRNKKA